MFVISCRSKKKKIERKIFLTYIDNMLSNVFLSKYDNSLSTTTDFQNQCIFYKDKNELKCSMSSIWITQKIKKKSCTTSWRLRIMSNLFILTKLRILRISTFMLVINKTLSFEDVFVFIIILFCHYLIFICKFYCSSCYW